MILEFSSVESPTLSLYHIEIRGFATMCDINSRLTLTLTY